MALRPALLPNADAPAAAGRSSSRVPAQMATHKLTPPRR
jgi:hypothetical protein